MVGPVGVAGLFIQLAATITLAGLLLLSVEFLWYGIFHIRAWLGGRGFSPLGYGEYIILRIINVQVWLLFIGLMTFLVLLLLWQTRRKHKIRKALLLRVVLHATLSLILARTLVFAMFGIAYIGVYLMSGKLARPVNPAYLSSYIALALALICFVLGLKTHLRIDEAWRLTGLVVFVVVVVLAFVLVQAGLYYGTFQVFRNPINDSLTQFLPPFWLP